MNRQKKRYMRVKHPVVRRGYRVPGLYEYMETVLVSEEVIMSNNGSSGSDRLVPKRQLARILLLLFVVVVFAIAVVEALMVFYGMVSVLRVIEYLPLVQEPVEPATGAARALQAFSVLGMLILGAGLIIALFSRSPDRPGGDS